MPRDFSPDAADIHFAGANSDRVIEAEHYVRSQCGHWVTVWTDYGDVPGKRGAPDMKIPRERIVMIEPRETSDTASESEQETTREVTNA